MEQTIIEISQKLDEDQDAGANNIYFLLDVGQVRS